MPVFWFSIFMTCRIFGILIGLLSISQVLPFGPSKIALCVIGNTLCPSAAAKIVRGHVS